ncbi:HI1506-related protein [Pseudomonas fluorescens]|uniref:HI1506-related protein n=1 Tax=Pseudomonas fluorescens TaxID=294 RepID=UPI0007D0A21D|nr:HI1506-related protein [Pseudomonas fluorescens]
MTIVISAKRDGFRRCGIAHPSTPTSYPDDFFTEEQLDALDKEPQLVLAYAADGFDLVQEPPHEPLSQVALPQAPNALEAIEPQALETNATAVGDAVVGTVGPILGDSEHGSNVEGTGPVPVTGPVDTSNLHVNQEQPTHDDPTATLPAPGDAIEQPAKPDKSRAAKAKDNNK